MIKRHYYDLKKLFYKNKVIVILGPRQVGKTTLITDFIKNTSEKCLYTTGDDIRFKSVLSSSNLDLLKDFCDDYRIIAIDEASRIPNIGINLKLITDNIPNVQLIVSSSSSFELSGQVGEPLTGRKIDIFLFPLSFMEMKNYHSKQELRETVLRHSLVYGLYPEVVTEKKLSNKAELLYQIASAYLLKDILEFEKVKNSKVIFDLLKLLSFQIGSEVSLNEIGNTLKLDHKTVGRYIDLLEKAYIVYNLRPYSTNLRKEIAKKSKYFFYDLGLRNAIIRNFNQIEDRDDVGRLFENFVVNERIKRNTYLKEYANYYFWRTVRGEEIDLIEEREGKIEGCEIKMNSSKSANKKFLEYYPKASLKVINKSNLLDFIL